MDIDTTKDYLLISLELYLEKLKRCNVQASILERNRAIIQDFINSEIK